MLHNAHFGNKGGERPFAASASHTSRGGGSRHSSHPKLGMALRSHKSATNPKCLPLQFGEGPLATQKGLICSDDTTFAFETAAGTQKRMVVIFRCWLRFVQPVLSRAHAGRTSGSCQSKFWGWSLPQSVPELCRQLADHGTKRAARLYRLLGPAWLR